MATIPALQHAHLQALCDVLAETASGLSGSEIGRLLSRCGIDDPEPMITKRHRLFAALAARQQRDRCGNHVVAFVQAAMDPASYVSAPAMFDERRAALNRALAFAGMHVGEDGAVRQAKAAQTISEASERAGKMRNELEKRRVHHDVLRFCKAELMQDNYFHAVLEATKSVADKIRDKSGLAADGATLVDAAFGRPGGATPLLAFNTLRTESEESEHSGLMNLIKGMFGAFRNPTAHAAKVSWQVTEDDALDLLVLASMLHRRLDRAVRTR